MGQLISLRTIWEEVRMNILQRRICIHIKLTLDKNHMFVEMGFLSQGNNNSKQLKLMESEIKTVANVFSQNCRLESFYTILLY